MHTKNLSMPEDALVNMLKTLPVHALIEIFWRTFVESDTSPLTEDEREELEKGKTESAKGKTIKWTDIK